jgi:hypothetical protein
MPEKTTAEMKRTLGVTGLTMNAMALIAPGAFLWLSFAGQAASVLGAAKAGGLTLIRETPTRRCDKTESATDPDRMSRK